MDPYFFPYAEYGGSVSKLNDINFELHNFLLKQYCCERKLHANQKIITLRNVSPQKSRTQLKAFVLLQKCFILKKNILKKLSVVRSSSFIRYELLHENFNKRQQNEIDLSTLAPYEKVSVD